MPEAKRWVLIATAPNQTIAELWRNRLEGEGIPAMIQAGDVTSFLGVSGAPCRLLVPHGYEEDARQLLAADPGAQDADAQE